MNREDVIEHLRAAAPVIAPSMLKCDFGNLHREVERLSQAAAQVLHWDVMDGAFVPNLSYGAMVIDRVRPLTEMVFDAHLMIAEPDRYLDTYLDAGCDAVTFHVEAVPNPAALLNRIRSAGRIAGLAINPGTPVESILPFVGDCDLVLVMSVEPGFGGQAFMPEVLPKLTALREARSDLLLSIDGGIAVPTISSAASAGADLFVAGSAIFDQSDYSDAIDALCAAASTTEDAQGVS